jgi:hypothetical protein
MSQQISISQLIGSSLSLARKTDACTGKQQWQQQRYKDAINNKKGVG